MIKSENLETNSNIREVDKKNARTLDHRTISRISEKQKQKK